MKVSKCIGLLKMVEHKNEDYNLVMAGFVVGRVVFSTRMGVWRLFFRGQTIGEFKTLLGAYYQAVSIWEEEQ